MSRTRSKQIPFTTTPDGYLEPKIGSSGYSALPAKTVIEQFKDTKAKHGSKNAMALKRPENGEVGVRKYIFLALQVKIDDFH